MHKLETPFGYLCLPDERMAENAKTMYNSMRETKDLHVITEKPNQDMWSKLLLDAPIQTDMMSFLILNVQQSGCIVKISNKIRGSLKTASDQWENSSTARGFSPTKRFMG